MAADKQSPAALSFKTEGLLRGGATALAAAATVTMALDSQTNTIFYVQRRATFTDINALYAVAVAGGVAAGYQFLRLLFCCFSAARAPGRRSASKPAAWVGFLLDQGAAYATFAVVMAALQGSLIAITGAAPLQWSKLCNMYTRFCFQVGGSLVCGLVAVLAMEVVAALSGFHLFRLYPAAPACSSLASDGASAGAADRL